MTPFHIYKYKGFQYLAVTPTLGLRVLKDGLSKSLYRIKRPVSVPDVDVQLIIDNPGKQKDDALAGNIKLARECWINYGMTRNKRMRAMFYQAVISCCFYFNQTKLRQYNIRDVAKLIGIKSNRTFYHVMALEARRQLIGKQNAVASAKDITLIKSVNNFRQIWPSIVGYSKKLDSMFKAELNIYVSTMKARSLRIEELQ